MGTQALNLFCARCQGETGHTQGTTSHGFHLVMSILTAGLWIVVWVLSILGTSGPKCSHCGATYSQGAAAKAKARLHVAPVAAMPPAMKRCPYCAEEVRAEAIRCRFCSAHLEPMSLR